MSEPRWEHFPHGADIGIRGVGPTMASAFEQVALALTAVLTDPSSVASKETVEIRCEASTADELLYDWVDTLIYEMSTRSVLFGAYDVKIDGFRLRARALGETVDRARHEPAIEVKAPTYTELRVARVDDQWVAQCVVDV